MELEIEYGGMAVAIQNMATVEKVQAVSGSRVRSSSGAQSTAEASTMSPTLCGLWCALLSFPSMLFAIANRISAAAVSARKTRSQSPEPEPSCGGVWAAR